MQVPGFVTQLLDFPRRIHAFERRQVNHVQDHFQALHLGFFFDATLGEPSRPLDDAYLIDLR